MMNYLEAKKYLLGPEINTSILGLDRINLALSELGNPQMNVRVVHVVGSNGKGSTSTMIAGILDEVGLKCGLFSSPYITELTEYIKIGNEEISCSEFSQIADELKGLIEEKGIKLTHFEFITVMSVLYFSRHNCDLCIYEAGMGGREDATNIFADAICNVLCSITVEHSQWLGNTIEEIVYSKLGIAHPGEIVISTDIVDGGALNDNTAIEISRYCSENNLSLFGISQAVMHGNPKNNVLQFDLGNYTDITLNTGAKYQLKNAATAIRACEIICDELNITMKASDVRNGLSNFALKSRFEVISSNPETIIDGGHNPACIKELVKSLDKSRKYIIVTGVMADKDYEAMYEVLALYAKAFVAVDDQIKRAIHSCELTKYLEKYGVPVYDAGSCELGAVMALELVEEFADDRISVLFTGTLYMTDSFKKSYKAFLDRETCNSYYREMVARLTEKSFYSANYGLGDIKKLLEYLGSPEKELKVFHVAGTNGKGSTCKMLHTIIRELGYSSGLFTSPYIRIFNERIQINEENISNTMLTALTNRVLQAQKELGIDLNQFALVTVIALLYYRLKGVDYVILETGLGGEFDPTNIISKPVCTAITNIGLDHVGVLGDSIEKIASAKAGIIKSCVPNVCYPIDKPALDVIKNKCNELSAPLMVVDKQDVEIINTAVSCIDFKYLSEDYHVTMNGDFQAYNACVAITAIETVFGKNANIAAKIKAGLNKMFWPGRLELISEKPLCFMDGGHNPQCIKTVTGFLDKYYGEYKKIYIAGFMKDKDYSEMIKLLSESADKLFLVPVEIGRALSYTELIDVVKTNKLDAVVYKGLKEAYIAAESINEDKLVCFIGSLYQLTSIYELFEK